MGEEKEEAPPFATSQWCHGPTLQFSGLSLCFGLARAYCTCSISQNRFAASSVDVRLSPAAHRHHWPILQAFVRARVASYWARVSSRIWAQSLCALAKRIHFVHARYRKIFRGVVVIARMLCMFAVSHAFCTVSHVFCACMLSR